MGVDEASMTRIGSCASCGNSLNLYEFQAKFLGGTRTEIFESVYLNESELHHQLKNVIKDNKLLHPLSLLAKQTNTPNPANSFEEHVNQLIQDLERGITDEQLIAIQNLGFIPDPQLNRLIDVLCNNATEDGEPSVRLNALSALDHIVRKFFFSNTLSRMIEPLIKALSDQNVAVRFGAVSTVENLLSNRIHIPEGMDAPMVDSLISILAMENESIAHEQAKSTAAMALAWLAASSISPEVKARMVEPLVSVLEENRLPYTLWNASRALTALAESDLAIGKKNEMIDLIFESLRNGTPERQEGAAYALESIASSEDVPAELKDRMVQPLMESLGNSEVRLFVVRALAELTKSNMSGDLKKEIAETLIGALENENSDIHDYAVSVSMELVESSIPLRFKKRMIEPLINALDDENPEIRGYSVMALAAFTESNIADISRDLRTMMVEPLIRNLEEENASYELATRRNAACALANLAQSNIPRGSKVMMAESFLRIVSEYDGQEFGCMFAAARSPVGSAVRGLEILVEKNIPEDLKARIQEALDAFRARQGE